MTDLNARFGEWMRTEDDGPNAATPAATVLALRDGADGPEVLMVQRNSRGTFASNWVFPGGKVDPEDHEGTSDIVHASRRAAAREAFEEADLVIDETTLEPYSHWMPPTVLERRFATWFFLAPAPEGPDGDVTVDGGEIVDHLWVRPIDALNRHAAGEVELVPPTWITLTELTEFDSTAAALAAVRSAEPFFYLTRMISEKPRVIAWTGDAGWETGDADTPGGRHRLEIGRDGWQLHRS